MISGADMIHFPPSRAAALQRLAEFLPFAGEAYAKGRNTDFGPDERNAVSRLSPYLRYRLITEEETAIAVLDRHRFAASEKFVQEVLWRTYFKGWLEMRPSVWDRFCSARDQFHATNQNQADLRAAEDGRTGIEGFDDWARELVETGYLHNHARMWFASIWIFTLRLPWELGADFFFRHLLDADPASNTLSWRWVAGLQTPGKTYLATQDNIARYTNGRFSPKGLAREAVALTEHPVGPPRPLAPAPSYDRDAPSLWLVTHEDLNIQSLITNHPHIAAIIILNDDNLLWGDKARDFVRSATGDAATRLKTDAQRPVIMMNKMDAEQIISAAHACGAKQILTAYAPIGPVADQLRDLYPILAQHDVKLITIRRDWDSLFWPDATRGFFNFKQTMAARLEAIRAAKTSEPQLLLFPV